MNDKAISVSIDIDEAQRYLSAIEKQQFPFACARALTMTARDAKVHVQKQLPRIFDRPTPFTVNSLYSSYATKKNLYAEVGYREWATKGTPAYKYLSPNVYGLDRPQKASERLLERRGLIPRGSRLVATKAVSKNQYGNVPGGMYTRILSGLGAHTQAGFTANSRRGSKNAKRYFIGTPRGGTRPAGIYERFKGHIKPLFFIESKAHYRPMFHIQDLVEQAVAKAWVWNFDTSMKIALDNAKNL
jgi:hypothetical protein